MTDLDAVKITEDEVEDLSKLTQIQNKYSFWFRGGSPNAGKVAVINYQESIKKVCSFQTVEHFWRIYDHLKRPSQFKVTTEYHLFKEGITPTWEDPQNKLGGKWMIRLKKGIASRYWEDVVLAIIGEQFDVGPEICGAVISVRNNEDIISIWNKTADNTEAVNKIRDQLRRIWKLPSLIAIEYKRHQDSLVDKSSYRNPSMVWRAPSIANKTNNGPPNNNNNNGEQKTGGYVPHYARNNDNRGGPQNDNRGGPQDARGQNNDNSHGSGGNGSSTNSSYPKTAWKPNRVESSDTNTNKEREAVKTPAAAWGNKSAALPVRHDGEKSDLIKQQLKLGGATAAAPVSSGWQRGAAIVKGTEE